MRLLDLLDRLDETGVTLTMHRGQIRAAGTRGSIAIVGPAITEHRDLLAAHLAGIHTGHLLAFCEGCGAPTMTAAKTPAGKHRDNWPRCRDTPACGGRTQHGASVNRHTPRPVDLERWANCPPPPPQPRPPANATTNRYTGAPA